MVLPFGERKETKKERKDKTKESRRMSIGEERQRERGGRKIGEGKPT